MVTAELLHEALHALAARIEREVNELRDLGRIEFHTDLYTIRPDYRLRYSVDPTIVNFEIKTGEEQIWAPESFNRFTEELKVLSEYENALAQVSAMPPSGRIVENFARCVASKSALSKTRETFDREVEIALRDLTGAKLEFSARIWLTGVTLATDS